MRRLIAGAAIAVAVVIVVISILPRGGGGPASPGASGASATVPPVPVSGEVVAEGRAIPTRTAALEVPIPGTVVAIAELGAAVAEGEDLISLDPATADAEIAVAEAVVASATAARDQARALVSQSTASIAAAEAGVDQAQASLRRTQAARELVPDDAEDARIDVAEADIDTAEAVVARAEAELDGAAAARNAAQRGVDVAEAEVVRAQAALASATLALQNLTVHAPFGGEVAFVGVGVGERASPGLPVVRIADTSSWTFETTDLGEEGVARISAGDAATITFDGQPGMQIAGRVTQIALFGQDRQGDVVYRVIVEPTAVVPATTRWNMTVTISIRPGA